MTGYLLSLSHPIGRFKAAFFASLGFSIENWQELRQELLSIALLEVTSEGRFTRYGNKFEIVANLEGPVGRSMEVRTIWIVRDGEDVPRFVTAYPDGGEP